jgi:hypothetical protein
MANSAHTTTIKTDRDQAGVIGKLRTKRATVTFGSDYAAAVLPLITAAELGLSEVIAVIPEGSAKGTAIGDSVAVAITTGGASFTLALFNGATPIGTVNESGTTIDLLVLGH